MPRLTKRLYRNCDGDSMLIDEESTIRYGYAYFPENMLEANIVDRVNSVNYDINLEPIFDSVYDERRSCRKKKLNKGKNKSGLTMDEKLDMIVKAVCKSSIDDDSSDDILDLLDADDREYVLNRKKL